MTPAAHERDEEPGELTVGAVAARLGVAVTTLRTWERRYGLGPSRHQAGRHRRYTATDVTRLEAMRRLTNRGMPPAAAAQMATESADPGRLSGTAVPRAASRDGGGSRALRLGRADSMQSRGLARAALRLDAQAVRDTIMESLAAHGTITTWTTLLIPVLRAMGQRWETRGDCVDAEHLLSREIAAAMRHRQEPGDSPTGRTALLACAPDEDHVLALDTLTAVASEHCVPTVNLGARVPTSTLLESARRVRPAVVAVWAQTRETGDADCWTTLRERGANRRLLALGPGWDRSRLPAGVETPGTLLEALDVLQVAS